MTEMVSVVFIGRVKGLSSKLDRDAKQLANLERETKLMDMALDDLKKRENEFAI